MKPPSRRALIVLSAAVAGVLLAGTAYAALPRPAAPALVTCMNTTTGAVRLVDTTRGQSCHPRRETAVATGAFGTGPATGAVPESTIRDAVDRAVAQALAQALAGVPRDATVGISSLDGLEGLPCNVGSPDAGVVGIRYAPPQFDSTITMTCLSSTTITTAPTPVPPSLPRPPDPEPPSTTAPPPTTEPSPTTTEPPPTCEVPHRRPTRTAIPGRRRGLVSSGPRCSRPPGGARTLAPALALREARHLTVGYDGVSGPVRGGWSGEPSAI